VAALTASRSIKRWSRSRANSSALSNKLGAIVRGGGRRAIGHGNEENGNMPSINIDRVKSAVITVGAGRGFVIEHKHSRLVITAAHCLQRGDPPEPYLPPAHGMSYTEERTYVNFLAPLGQEPTVWAECLFADPVADIAVLGEPDNQTLWNEAEAYETFVDAASPLLVSSPPKDGPAFVLSLAGDFVPCTVECHGNGPLFLLNTGLKEGVEGGDVRFADFSA
jgi:hypothetical protein